MQRGFAACCRTFAMQIATLLLLLLLIGCGGGGGGGSGVQSSPGATSTGDASGSGSTQPDATGDSTTAEPVDDSSQADSSQDSSKPDSAEDSTDTPASEPLPELEFAASKAVALPGESVELRWKSRGASSCAASGGWSGARPPSGSQRVGPLQSDEVYALSCRGAGGTRLGEVLVQVRDEDGVVVELEATQPTVRNGRSAHLKWTTRNAERCESSGGWAGERPASGQHKTVALQQDTTFRLTCFGKGERAIGLVTVTVTDGRLRWRAPTKNVDGSTLSDLNGFKVYWGAESGQYEGSHRVGSKPRGWLVDLPSGSYFFVVTAVDSDGNESAYSNEVERYIP